MDNHFCPIKQVLKTWRCGTMMKVRHVTARPTNRQSTRVSEGRGRLYSPVSKHMFSQKGLLPEDLLELDSCDAADINTDRLQHFWNIEVHLLCGSD